MPSAVRARRMALAAPTQMLWNAQVLYMCMYVCISYIWYTKICYIIYIYYICTHAVGSRYYMCVYVRMYVCYIYIIYVHAVGVGIIYVYVCMYMYYIFMHAVGSESSIKNNGLACPTIPYNPISFHFLMYPKIYFSSHQKKNPCCIFFFLQNREKTEWCVCACVCVKL